MKSTLLILVFCLSTLCLFSEDLFKPVFFTGDVKGKNVTFMIRAEEDFPKLKKLKGTTLINFEPGCLMVETYCKYLDYKRLQIELTDEGFYSSQTKKLLGIEESIFIVEFKPEKAPNRLSKILSVVPVKNKKSEPQR